MQIKIKAAQAHYQQRENEDVRRELTSIQEYIDENISDLEEAMIYFVPLQGNYIHIKRAMVFIGVFISTRKESIQGIAGDLKVRMKECTAEAANIRFEFPPEFLGTLEYAEGFPVHFEVPVRGMKEDREIKSHDFLCEITEVTILSEDEKEQNHEEN